MVVMEGVWYAGIYNHLNWVLKHVYRIEMIINKVGLEVIWESDNERIYWTVITRGYTGL